MLFSHSAAYAVRALIWLACQPKDSRWLATDVAQREGIPQPYLSKVLGVLKSHGYIHSTRGPRGGYVLAQDPSTISLLKISELFDSDKRMSTCVLAYGPCGECALCPLGEMWTTTKATIQNFLETTTIATLAQRSPQNTATAHTQTNHE